VQLADDVNSLDQYVKSAVIRGCGYRFSFLISRRLDGPVVEVETVEQMAPATRKIGLAMHNYESIAGTLDTWALIDAVARARSMQAQPRFTGKSSRMTAHFPSKTRPATSTAAHCKAGATSTVIRCDIRYSQSV
jgi:hypothetical protein